MARVGAMRSQRKDRRELIRDLGYFSTEAATRAAALAASEPNPVMRRGWSQAATMFHRVRDACKRAL